MYTVLYMCAFMYVRVYAEVNNSMSSSVMRLESDKAIDVDCQFDMNGERKRECRNGIYLPGDVHTHTNLVYRASIQKYLGN